MKAPPCWFIAMMLLIQIPFVYILYGWHLLLLNIVAVMGWVLAEIYERKEKREST